MDPPDPGVPASIPRSDNCVGWARARCPRLPRRRSFLSVVLVVVVASVTLLASWPPSIAATPDGGPGPFLSPAAGPSLTFTPASGVVGSLVVLTGSGFTPGNTVTPFFGGTSVTCNEGTVLVGAGEGFNCTVTVPASSAGTYAIAANTTADGMVTAVGSFTVEPALTFSPTSGIVGSIVVLNGSGFTAGSAVTPYFGGASSSCNEGPVTVPVNGSFLCTVTVPAAPAGSYAIAANTTADGTVLAAGFFLVGPSLSLNPTFGVVGGTTSATGTGFAGSHSITFKLDGAPASSACLSDASGSFVCPVTIPAVPSGPQPMVASDTTNSASATFDVQASLSLSPTSGAVGATPTATGAGFQASHAITFKLDGAAATSTCTSGATGGFTCTVLVPAVPNGAQLMVASDGTNTASTPFTVDASLSLNPTSGNVGGTTSATGTGFFASSSITFTLAGVAAAPSCSSDVTGSFVCTVTIPAVPHGPQSLVASDGTNSASASFTVGATLVLSPTTGIVGSTTTATGSGFAASHAISFKLDGASATSVCTSGVSGSFACPVTIPSVPNGAQSMVASDGTNTATAMFTVTPVSITVTPGQGPVGASMTVAGSGFTVSSGATVSFAGVDRTPTVCTVGTAIGTTITTSSSGTFSCAFKVPAESAGSYSVVATDLTTSDTTGPISFTVTPLAITVDPGQGPAGAAVSVAGSGFSVSTLLGSLDLDGVPVTTCTTGSLTTGSTGSFVCGFAVPGGTSGTTVTATDAGGQSASAAFTVTVPSIVVTPGQGPVGATVTVTGSGFSVATTVVSLVFDGVRSTVCKSGSLSASSTGTFSCSFAVPSATSGTSVVATDVGGRTASGTFTVTTPTVMVTPGQGPPGSSFTVNGSGFTVSSNSTVRIDGAQLTPTTCSEGSNVGSTITTSPTGAISCTFLLPALPGGNVTITMTQAPYQANSTFVVTAALGLSTTRGIVGSFGVATGGGFAPSDAYSVIWNGSTTLCAGTANSSGEFRCPYAIPGAPAGLHTITAVQGAVRATETFTVLPGLALSPVNGTVGSTITVFGTGFDATMHYQVSWNISTVLCSGTTNTNGGFECTFVVPPSVVGPATITAAEGSYAPTTPFTVAPSPPPPPATSTPFPWWIVATAALVVSALLVVAIVLEQRRHRALRARAARPTSARPVQPWEEGVAPAASPGSGSGGAPVAAAGPSAAAAPVGGEPEDIDAMIARLEKMSVEMFKKTPKQLSEQGFEDGTPDPSKGS